MKRASHLLLWSTVSLLPAFALADPAVPLPPPVASVAGAAPPSAILALAKDDDPMAAAVAQAVAAALAVLEDDAARNDGAPDRTAARGLLRPRPRPPVSQASDAKDGRAGAARIEAARIEATEPEAPGARVTDAARRTAAVHAAATPVTGDGASARAEARPARPEHAPAPSTDRAAGPDPQPPARPAAPATQASAPVSDVVATSADTHAAPVATPDTHAATDAALDVTPEAAPPGAAAAASAPAIDLAVDDPFAGTEGAFTERRAALLDRMALAAEDDPAARLDLAALYASRMMLPEAASHLAGLAGAAADPRHAALSAVTGILSGAAGPEVTDDPALGGWPPLPLLRAVALARAGDLDAAGALVPGAAGSLDALPVALRAAMLPDLLETAINAGEWQLAHDLAGRFDDHAELRQSPAYWFLLGQAAQSGGKPLAAFDAYERATSGADAFAHRARVALVELGLSTGTLTAPEALDLLETARWMWRGDRAAGAGAMLLGDLAAADRPVVAAMAYGQVMRESPVPAQAALARQKARVLLQDYYGGQAASDGPLDAFLDGHRRITRVYRFEDGYAEQAEHFADRFLRAGMTVIAAEEFGALHDQQVLAQELELWPVTPDRPAHYRLRQVEALLAGGRPGLALALLDKLDGDAGVTDDQRRRAHALRLQALSDEGRDAAVLTAGADAADPLVRRLKAEAYYSERNWEKSRDVYAALWRDDPDGLAVVDALRLILSAYRAGDADTVEQVSAAYPDLGAMPEWSQIANGLTRDTRRPGLLSDAAARADIDNADRLLDRLGRVEEGGSQN